MGTKIKNTSRKTIRAKKPVPAPVKAAPTAKAKTKKKTAGSPASGKAEKTGPTAKSKDKKVPKKTTKASTPVKKKTAAVIAEARKKKTTEVSTPAKTKLNSKAAVPEKTKKKTQPAAKIGTGKTARTAARVKKGDEPIREPDLKELRQEELLLAQPGPAPEEISAVDPDIEPDPVKRDALKFYMEQIGTYPRITVEDEVRLAKLIHGKNVAKRLQAEETLINANLRLVVKIAHDFKGLGLPLSDLISEGNIGLMRSVAKFDPTKGAKFSSYAAWWIKQSMHRALSNQTKPIRIPVQTGAKIHKVRRMREELQLQLGREPEIAELAAALNFSERTVTMLLHAESSVFSLHDPIKTGENDTFEELIEDPNAKSPETLCSNADSMQMLHQAFARLDPRERQVLTMRFFEGLTLEEASRQINRTRERVRQIQSQALQKLRVMMAEESEVVNS